MTDEEQKRELTEDEDAAVIAWRDHPLTKRTIRNLGEEREKAMLELMGHARKSTDPNVMKWAARVDTLAALQKTLNGEGT